MMISYAPARSSLAPVYFTIDRDGTHRLADAYDYVCEDGTRIIVWAGFAWNGASVPPLLHPVLPPHSLSIVAGLVHDFLYAHGGVLPHGNVVPYREFTRGEADRIFAEAMRREGVPRVKRWAAYRAVSWFGGDNWKAPRLLGRVA